MKNITTDLTTFALAALATFAAAYIRGLTGFGMAIILVPLLGLILSPAQAVVLGILLQLLIGPVGIKTILADAQRASALPIAALAMLATPAGLWLLGITPPDLARLLIALIAIGAFLLVLLPPMQAGTAPGKLQTGITGIAAGLLTGFAAMPGPPVVPFYLRQSLPPATMRASMMLIFFATAIAGSLAAVAMGKADARLWLWALALFLPMLLGNHLGGRAFGSVSPALWRSVVAVILGLAGASALWRYFGQ